MPGLHFDIVRPKQILVTGIDLDGNDVEFEADELLARLVQHELDHLDGVLLLDHLDDEQRKAAKKTIRELQMGTGSRPSPCRRGRCSGSVDGYRCPPSSPAARAGAGEARVPGEARRWRCRRCVPCSMRATRSCWWCPTPTGAGAGGASPPPPR